MNKEASFFRMLEVNAQIQRHVSVILEAKAKELRKSRNWVCSYLQPQGFEEHKSQLEEALKLHEQMIEVIEGITKVESSLNKNLGSVLGAEEGGSGMLGGEGFPMGGLFDGGGELK